MKNSLMKAICLIGCILMMIPNVQYAKETQKKATPGTAIFVMATPKQEPEISENKIVINKPELKLDISIPQFNFLQDKAFQNKLNQRLQAEAKQREKEIVRQAEALNKDILIDGLQPIPFEYKESFNNMRAPYPYYSIELHKYQYSGGAHGYNELSYINLNQETNQLILLKDLFKPNVNYIGIINELINQEIAQRKMGGEFFYSGSEGFQTIKEKQLFFINENGEIVIVFNEYEIAPYASSPIYIKLSKNKLQDYLK